MLGTVAKWNEERGFGFIRADDDRRDVFVHYSAIQMEGRRSLYVGQRVEFEIAENERGVHAAYVLPAEADAAVEG